MGARVVGMRAWFGIVVYFSFAPSVFAKEFKQTATPKLSIEKGFATVSVNQVKVLTVLLNDKKPEDSPDGAHDEAKLIANCLLVRRGVKKTELFPEVTSTEIYTLDGKKQILDKKSGIRRLGGNFFVPPSNAWAVMLDEEEGEIMGFFFFDSSCKVSLVTFSKSLHWGSGLGKQKFLDQDTLFFHDLAYPDNLKAKVRLKIKSDGSYSIE